MNYRHAFHAGNFADVAKHALIVSIVEYLKRKEKPFRVIDTHAGRGAYDLAGEEAVKTAEHLDGITRLLGTPLAASPLLSTYLDVVTRDGPSLYPGSPLIVRRLLRRQDRLSAYELHPADAAALSALFAGDVQVKTIELDGWLALGGHLPPKEKRGLVLIDPPFEQPGEIERIVAGVAEAHKRWPGGIYAIWYPIKRFSERARLLKGLADTGIPKIVAAEFLREEPTPEETLIGSGLVVVNPPYTFADEAKALLTIISQALGKNDRAVAQLVAISTERP